MTRFFLSLVSKEDGGASKIKSRLSRYMTDSMKGVLKLRPGVSMGSLTGSPKRVTIASCVSSTVNSNLTGNERDYCQEYEEDQGPHLALVSCERDYRGRRDSEKGQDRKHALVGLENDLGDPRQYLFHSLQVEPSVASRAATWRTHSGWP